jgi:predicted  nucleic acid-binding Zn-ribbon protein
MKSDLSARAGTHPSIVLSAFLEPLVRGRRVAVLGDATTGLAEELAGRGARLIHAYDPDAARAAEALAKVDPGRSSPVSYALLGDDLGVRDGAFDVVIVPDLALFADPAELLRRTRKLCAASGAAIVGTRNARVEGRRLIEPREGARGKAPPGYYELYDLVSLQFAKVRMIGQAPFVGYTVADFAASGELEVSVDTSLLGASEEPEYFIAVAGDRSIALDAYTVVGLPWAEVAQGFGGGEAGGRREEERLALTEAQTKLLVLGAELEALRDRQRSENESRAQSATGLSARVAELEQEIAGREGRLREIESRAGDNHVRAERLAHQIRDLEEELRRQRDRGTRLTKQLDDEKRARTKAELELGMIRGRLAAPPEAAGASADDRLREAELTRDLETARLRIDSLASELEAARLRISELEQETAETRRRTPTDPAAAPPDPKLIHRLNELEHAVSATLREAETAAAARDAAIERARRAEARSQRMLELEAALMSAEAARNDLVEQVQKLEARIAAGDPRSVELERRLGDREQRLADGRGKLHELALALDEERARSAERERRLGESEHERDEAELRLREASAQLAELTGHLAEGGPIVAELESRLAQAEQRSGELSEASSLAEAATSEVASLEAALRERGKQVAALKQDLAESERIGKELVAELVLARESAASAPEPPPPAPPPPPPPPAPRPDTSRADADDLRARLDALAQSAARSEADLQAATWRIAQLERSLAEAGEGARPAGTVQRELESALASARAELASLRRALGAH